jgi:hypothetical protein
MNDHRAPASPDPEQQRVIDAIVNELWERFPKRYARQLLQGRENLVSLDTLTSTSMRRLVQAFQSKDLASLNEMRNDLRRAMGYLQEVMFTAVENKVRRLSRQTVQSLGEFDPATKEPDDHLERLTLLLLSQRELASAGDRTILEMRDDRRLNYDEIFLQERWSLVSDRLPPETQRLLTPIFGNHGVVGDRTREFQGAVQQALDLLTSLGHGLTDDAKEALYRRYEKARGRLQRRLEKLVQDEFLN